MPSAADPLFQGNLLLKALRTEDRALLAPHLEWSVHQRGETLFAAGAEVTTIAFPCGQTVATLIIAMRDGRSAETATIGREGAVGGVVSQGYLPASTHAVIQIGGPVLRMDAVRFQEAKRRSESLRNLFARYGDCLLAQVLQSVACNALHPIEARCLRWLMTLQDRIASDTLPVTQELLAAMLGVQRTYLTRILRTLQQQGLIEVGRGRITVRDRAKVEAAACECHGVVRHHYETVLGAGYDRLGRLVRVEPPDETVPTERPYAQRETA
ncbi:Crp/Fnr family transcriptional regulator [Methylobacterium sp. Leaf469]|jgi:CRP-like cAMP-binding protein|uniref:Crp/Fnr family transcriptional regulator n=1 Tax=unclassified Methylobacterium TaxID=2615210 RepID=UPI0006F45323|nr:MULTISPECIES: Crp/Fnr family transcriptional regulator [unclassified Methylobacterium]USU34446.1 Crp/Fnr family transcriptional regulator [Methylobacterium sp. OTU13CASTA1]KQP31512.1 Crp/Fnr family transcriptional regulator [Methylobacterium sp. Leaf102]KQP32562.1 Crp/Fnr family transcriptional regulator [Methylobacterium sp. Leaf100]KQP67759.1 Crp/Fnr family transcriptional regulator [Methylobacterium sp. Leaf112]KQU00926.1 Crp/Fnr family transcriptional regulator [Methylobacterium sp. Lea